MKKSRYLIESLDPTDVTNIGGMDPVIATFPDPIVDRKRDQEMAAEMDEESKRDAAAFQQTMGIVNTVTQNLSSASELFKNFNMNVGGAAKIAGAVAGLAGVGVLIKNAANRVFFERLREINRAKNTLSSTINQIQSSRRVRNKNPAISKAIRNIIALEKQEYTTNRAMLMKNGLHRDIKKLDRIYNIRIKHFERELAKYEKLRNS